MFAVAIADRTIRLFAVGKLCLPQRGRGTAQAVDEEIAVCTALNPEKYRQPFSGSTYEIEI